MYRFDGLSIQPAPLSGLRNQVIHAICEDHSGTLWFGTKKNGVQCLPYSRRPPVSLPPQLTGGPVFTIAEDARKNLWFGTKKGLFRYDGKAVTKFTVKDGLPSNTIFKIAADHDVGLWVAARKGICFFEKNRFHKFDVPSKVLGRGFITLLRDSRGAIWFGTQEGVIRFKNERFKTYRHQDGLSDNHITSLMEDSSGNIWVGTWNGLNVLSGDRFITLTTDQGLAHNFIYDISQDREGNIWIASHSGISRLRSINIANFSRDNGLPHNTIYDILQDRDGVYWFGTPGGLAHYFNGTFKNYTTADGLVHDSIHALWEDPKGKIWIGTLGGLVSFSKGTFSPTPYLRDIIFTLKESCDGSLWVGARGGIFRVSRKSPQEGITHATPSAPLPFLPEYPEVTQLLEDQPGNLWFSSKQRLYKYTGKTVISINETYPGQLGNNTQSLFEDSRGIIWIGTENGLNRYDYREDSFIHYATDDGLPDNTCGFIQEDQQGQIWVGTENGLAVFDGHSFKAYTAGMHGLATDYWNVGFKDNSGVLWFGGADGLSRFKPPLGTNRVPPPIYISSVKILEKETPVAQLKQLNHKRNYIRFQFTGICLSAPESVVYRYKLDGIDPEWRQTKSPSVFYPYLPPGKFRFQVKAINNDGVESTAPAQIAFQITPPFWKTWWFLSLVLLAIFLLLTFLVLWRLKRDREKAELKAKNRQLVLAQRMELMGNLAAGTVHDLKNLLSIILGYTRIISRKYDRNDEGYQHVETIKDTAVTAVQMAKQILNLSRYPDELSGQLELAELLDDILKTLAITLPKGISINWERPGPPIPFAIHSGRFQQLVINLCQNAAHAMPNGGVLTVSLSMSQGNDGPNSFPDSIPGSPKEIILEIKDTGTGIAPEFMDKIFQPLFTTKKKGKGTGLGLFVVREIVEEYNGRIDVQSELDKGTVFRIYFASGGPPGAPTRGSAKGRRPLDPL